MILGFLTLGMLVGGASAGMTLIAGKSVLMALAVYSASGVLSILVCATISGSKLRKTPARGVRQASAVI